MHPSTHPTEHLPHAGHPAAVVAERGPVRSHKYPVRRPRCWPGEEARRGRSAGPGPGCCSALSEREPAEWGAVSCQPPVQGLWGLLLSQRHLFPVGGRQAPGHALCGWESGPGETIFAFRGRGQCPGGLARAHRDKDLVETSGLGLEPCGWTCGCGPRAKALVSHANTHKEASVGKRWFRKPLVPATWHARWQAGTRVVVSPAQVDLATATSECPPHKPHRPR